MNFSAKFTMHFILLCLVSLLVNSGGCMTLQRKNRKMQEKYAELKTVEFPDALIVKMENGKTIILSKARQNFNYLYISYGSETGVMLSLDGQGWKFEDYYDFANGRQMKSNWSIRAKTSAICPTLVKPEEWICDERGKRRNVNLTISKAPQCIVDHIMNKNPEKQEFEIAYDILEIGLSAGKILRTLNSVEKIYKVKHRTWPTKLSETLVRSVLRASHVILLISTFLNPQEFQKFTNVNSQIRRVRNAYLKYLGNTALANGSVSCWFGSREEYIQVFLKEQQDWFGKKSLTMNLPGFGLVKCGDVNWKVNIPDDMSLNFELRMVWIFSVQNNKYRFAELEIDGDKLVFKYITEVNKWKNVFRYHKSGKSSFTRAKRVRGEKIREERETIWDFRAKIEFPLLKKGKKFCIQDKKVRFKAWEQDVNRDSRFKHYHDTSLKILCEKTYENIGDLPIKSLAVRMKIDYN